MSKTKAKGTSRLGRDSNPKYLGVKRNDGQKIGPGMIIIKQRGTKYHPGENVKRGADDTLYAMKEGVVKFQTKRKTGFDGATKKIKVVNVV